MSDAITAAKNMDWQQVVLNGGQPCFHLEGDRFCGRAQRWAGHDEAHKFVSLAGLLQSASAAPKVKHEVTCKLFPDPYDERDPVGPCTCEAAPQEGVKIPKDPCAAIAKMLGKLDDLQTRGRPRSQDRPPSPPAVLLAVATLRALSIRQSGKKEDVRPTNEHRCGACNRGAHADCSGWCFCPCQAPQEGKADMEQCKVCYATPDAEGVIHHGKGCYQVSDEGGGESYVDVPPATPRGGGKSAMQRFNDMRESFSEHESDGNMYSKLRSLYFQVARELDEASTNSIGADKPSAT